MGIKIFSMQNGAQKRPERLVSRKTIEKEQQQTPQNNTSRKQSIASVVKDRASERARAHILSILKEAINKMELENKSQLVKSIGDDHGSEKETVELVSTSARKASTRSRTVQPSHKKPRRQQSRCSSRISTQASVSTSTTLTASALKTPRPRAKSAECRSTSSQRSKKLESSIASLQAENTALENQLRKLGEQLIIERQERVDLESRLAAIERSAGINPKLTLISTIESCAEVPRNSPSEDKTVARDALEEGQHT